MKKMQCEVCGSNEIKKVADDIFECQSCGVQYSKEEVQKLLVEITGKVKIDRSDDSENMIKRAKQFESSGDTEKAKEYYEKALDFDPDNKIASDALSKSAQDNCYIIEKNIDGDEAVKKSLEYLYSCENVAPDIFANITDVTITEKYYPFVEMSADLSGQFAGVACYKHEIPYTEYKDKQVYSNGRYHTEREAVTKYRTEIERKPATGFFSAEACGTYSISKEFGEKIARCAADKADAAEDLYSQLFSKAETKVTDIIKNIENIKKLDIERIVRDNDTSKYNNTEIEMDFKDKSWLERMGKQFLKEKGYSCQWSAESNCPGDYAENVSYTLITEKTENRIIYVPFLIVSYKYKNKDYIVLSVLNVECFEAAAVYPADKKATAIQEDLQIAKEKLNEASTPGCIAGLAGIVGGFLWIIGAFLSDSFPIIMYIGIAMLLLITLPCGLAALSISSKKRKDLEEIDQKASEQKKKISDILHNVYSCFYEEFSKTKDIVKASQKAKASFDAFSTILTFTDSIASFAKPKEVEKAAYKNDPKQKEKIKDQIKSTDIEILCMKDDLAHLRKRRNISAVMLIPAFVFAVIGIIYISNVGSESGSGLLWLSMLLLLAAFLFFCGFASKIGPLKAQITDLEKVRSDLISSSALDPDDFVEEDKSYPEAEHSQPQHHTKPSKKTIIASATAVALTVTVILCAVIPKLKHGKKENSGKVFNSEMLKSAKAGDIVLFGTYEQDNDTSNGKEDIEWLVLQKESDKALVISRYALDCQQYNTSYTDVTWETCSLRKWLNETFINNAFSTDEQNKIQSTTVTVDENPKYSTSPDNNTTDKVFLLNKTEVYEYFSTDEAIKCVPTDYSIAQGAYTSSSYSVDGKATCRWWLRAPGFYGVNAANIDDEGLVSHFDDVNIDNFTVRPAMWITVE